MPLSLFDDDARTKVSSFGANPGQWTGTVHGAVTRAMLGPDSELPSSADSIVFEFNGGQHISIDGGTIIGGGALTICAFIKWDSY